jgi:hypothetical protein
MASARAAIDEHIVAAMAADVVGKYSLMWWLHTDSLCPELRLSPACLALLSTQTTFGKQFAIRRYQDLFRHNPKLLL